MARRSSKKVFPEIFLTRVRPPLEGLWVIGMWDVMAFEDVAKREGQYWYRQNGTQMLSPTYWRHSEFGEAPSLRRFHESP
jgi:hypothetical protein